LAALTDENPGCVDGIPGTDWKVKLKLFMQLVIN
jgi:hypothetical protein